MRARKHVPEQMTRSGERQSKRERRMRTEFNRNNRTCEDDRFGVRLQRAVSERLTHLGIAHERYENRHPIARAERVELLVETGRIRVPRFKMQFTLRDQTRPKIFEFIEAALTGDDVEVPRVYLEIRATRQIGIKDLAGRIAHAIQRIIDKIRDFHREIGNVIGLALDATKKSWRDSLSPISLLRLLGTHARDALLAIHVRAESARKAAAQARAAASTAARVTTGTVHQIYSFLHRIHTGFSPYPQPVFVTSQTRPPIRIPTRRR